MRMRVLTHTSKGKLLTIADQVTKLISADKPTDTIMPAYPCDGERLIVIVATAKKSMPDAFCRFARSIKRSVSANVAFIIDGSEEYAKEIIEMVKTNNSNVLENDVLYITGGLPFKFAKKVTSEETATVEAWVKNILSKLV